MRIPLTCAILSIANACAIAGACVSDDHQPGRPEPAPAIPITIDRIESLERRTATLEAQQTWLHLEQLRAEVAGLRQTILWLIEYIAERDGADVVEHRGGAA